MDGLERSHCLLIVLNGIEIRKGKNHQLRANPFNRTKWN